MVRTEDVLAKREECLHALVGSGGDHGPDPITADMTRSACIVQVYFNPKMETVLNFARM